MKINIPLTTIHSPSKSKTINQLRNINSLLSLNILKPFYSYFYNSFPHRLDYTRFPDEKTAMNPHSCFLMMRNEGRLRIAEDDLTNNFIMSIIFQKGSKMKWRFLVLSAPMLLPKMVIERNLGWISPITMPAWTLKSFL